MRQVFSPIAWQSKRIKDFVKSLLKTETSLVETVETCFWLAKIIDEIVGYREQTTQIKCYSDSQSLCNAVHYMASLNKRLRVDTAILHEMMQREEIKNKNGCPVIKNWLMFRKGKVVLGNLLHLLESNKL